MSTVILYYEVPYCYALISTATTPEKVLGVGIWMLALIPAHFTGILATTRFYQIRYPLSHLSK